MRCIALAQAARSHKIPIKLIGHVEVPWVRQRLDSEGIEFVSLEGSIPVLEDPFELLQQLQLEKGAETQWVILDGYHFGLDCQKTVRDAGYKLLVIDDYAHLPEYSCDILLNQNFGAEKLIYAGDIGQKLIGPKFAMLRKEFSVARSRLGKQVFSSTPHVILLNLGGGDFSEYLAQLAPSFESPELHGCVLRVIAGAMVEEHIKKILQSCPATLEVLRGIGDMPAVLLKTELCVTAGGSSCWELCCLAVPFLTCCIAENQHAIIENLADSGVALPFSKETFRMVFNDLSWRERLSNKAKLLVDGLGANRVMRTMVSPSFYIRPVQQEDCAFLWELVSSEDVRSVSGSTSQFGWEEHCRWFSRRLSAEEPFFIACTTNGSQIAYTRFEWGAGSYSVSIALIKNVRGMGLGLKILNEACREVWKVFPDVTIQATVLDSNLTSYSMFLKAGFIEQGSFLDEGRTFLTLKANRQGEQ